MNHVNHFFQKLKLRERWLAFSLLAAFTALVWNFLVFREVREIAELRRETDAIRRESALLEEELEGLGERRPSSITADPAWKFKRVNKGLAALVRSVTSAEDRRDDFAVKKISSEKTERTAEFEKTTLQLEIEAPFNSLGAFLEDLERSELLTRVEAVQVTRPAKELKLCKARIVLNSYVWRDL